MLFMLLHMTLGIFLGWAFYEDGPTAGNWVYYLVLFLSAAGFIYYLFRLWRKPLNQ